jgi:two-component system phosphate regulon sensor histidine kinase PhoR/two-component system sensor histidine kinase VicK
MHGSLIALGADGTIAYASKTSPLVTIDGILRPQLLFSNDNSLDTWLEECHTSAIKAEKSWRRIPSRPADEEDARIYDVYASYEKGAQYETILTLVDQTELYKDGEEDLNFIAFAAHELRGPITVIRGYLDVLEDELSDVLVDDQKELFRRLTVSANRLSGYINNILNTSRYDRRHLNVSLVSDSLASIYATIADDMSLRASSQNRLLSVAISTDLPNIAADRASLGEVISNLIDNAIKYSNEGSAINVTAEHVGDFVELSVVDHGIGMPGSVVKNLFQKFYRSHRSRETVAGTGIGLYISKAIVESHGGTISVRSAEGEGSTFTVAIPTYASLAEKLNSSNNNNQGIISKGNGWIKNHSMYRG